MRLIDVDALKVALNSGGGESVAINISKNMSLGKIVDTVIQAYRKCLFAELEKMPTAYNVDKVVEQLGECKRIMQSPISQDCFGEECKVGDCMVCVFDKAIEIVKEGTNWCDTESQMRQQV